MDTALTPDRTSKRSVRGGGFVVSLGRRRVAALALVAAGGAGVAAFPATASATACGGANRTVASQGPSSAEAAVRCLVNEQRTAQGLSALGFDGDAAEAAQRHTSDMVRRRYFGHVSPGGSTIAKRITATGMRWRRVGENIAVGQRTPAKVVSGWMNSPSHCHNLMSTDFTVLGIGVSRKGTIGHGGATWTQVFARAKGDAAPGGPSVAC